MSKDKGKEKKKLLNKISQLDAENQKLFERKAKLEDEILAIDIEIYRIGGEYSNLCEKLLTKIND